MTVLFITRKYPPAIGGMETFSYGLTQALGKDCTVRYIKNRPWALLNSVWMSRRFDVIQLGDGVLTGLGVFIKKLFHKPIVVTVHGLDVTYRPKWYQAYIRWSLQRIDQVVCVSEATEQAVKKRLSINCVVIPHGVTVADWQLGKDRCRHLLFVGRLVPRKGCRWFVEQVFPHLPSDIELDIIGSGEEFDALPTSDRIHKYGSVDRDQLQQYYQTSWLLVMPNIVVPGDMEGFGMVALEAGACGLPVVAANLEGIRSAVIDGQTGFLVESGNVAAWVAAIERVLTHPFDAQQIRSQVAQHYSWEQVKQHYQAVYQSLTHYGDGHSPR